MCKFHIMNNELDPLFAALADLVVMRGMPFPELTECLKGHCVAAAAARAEGKVTDSRLSIMTGLQRRDVARLRAFEAKAPRATPLARLVSLWRTDPVYAPDGVPMSLPRTGEAPSFDALARTVRQDVHPRTMLDALISAGTVHAEGESVMLKQTAYLPMRGSPDQLAYLAVNVGDHLRAATANVDGASPPFFERAVSASGLSAEEAGALRAKFADGMMRLLEALNSEAEAMKRSATRKDGMHRVRLGGFGYGTKEESE